MEFKTDALMLKAVDYGENDKMVTLLTADRGKIGACMKGVKKANARLRFAAQPFCFAEYVLAEKSGRHTVISASLYDGFFPLREDVEKYYAAAVVCEACEKLAFEGMPCGELLVAAVTALKDLCGEETAFPLVKFLLTALRLAGYPVRADVAGVLPPPLGWSGDVLLNSPVGCEDRRDRRRGTADGVLAVPAAKTGRGVVNVSPSGAKALAVPERESTREAGERVLENPSVTHCVRDSSPARGAKALAPSKEGGRGVVNVASSGADTLAAPERESTREAGVPRHSLSLLGKVPEHSEGERVLSPLFFDMERGAFSLEKGTPASVVTYYTIREALGYETPPREKEGEKRALRLLYSYFAYQTDSELSSLPEFVRML